MQQSYSDDSRYLAFLTVIFFQSKLKKHTNMTLLVVDHLCKNVLSTFSLRSSARAHQIVL